MPVSAAVALTPAVTAGTCQMREGMLVGLTAAAAVALFCRSLTRTSPHLAADQPLLPAVAVGPHLTTAAGGLSGTGGGHRLIGGRAPAAVIAHHHQQQQQQQQQVVVAACPVAVPAGVAAGRPPSSCRPQGRPAAGGGQQGPDGAALHRPAGPAEVWLPLGDLHRGVPLQEEDGEVEDAVQLRQQGEGQEGCRRTAGGAGRRRLLTR